MFGEVGEIIGQGLSILAVISGFLAYQMKSAGRILIFHIATALLFTAHYLLIGAMTAAALNFIGAIKCLCFYFRNARGSKGLFVPIFFTVLVAVTSILTWDGWYSALIMTGLIVSSVGLTFSDPQIMRGTTLIKSPLCLAYNVIVRSTGGIIFEIATLTSAILGLIRHRKKKPKPAEAAEGKENP